MTMAETSIPQSNPDRVLESLALGIRDGILVIDCGGIVRFANSTAREILSPRVEELVGFEFGIPVSDERAEINLIKDTPYTLDMQVSEIRYHGKIAYLVFLHDISEQKQLEDHLINQERLLEATGKMARVGGWEIDLTNRTVWWSEVTREIHEVEADFVPSLEDALSFYPEDAHDRIRQAVEKLMTAGEPYDLELPLVTAMGNSLWVHTLGNAEFDGGKCVRAWGTFQDITENKKTLLQFQRSEQRYRRLFDNSLDGFALTEIVVDDAGTVIDALILDINKAFTELLGIPKEKAVGASAGAVVPGIDNTPLWETFTKVVETGEPQYLAFYSDIYDKYFRILAYHSIENQIVTIFNDVTDQVQAEKELRQSERRYKQLFTNAIFGFALHEVILNEDGEPVDFVYLEINEAFSVQTGLDPEKIIGKTITECLPHARETGLIDVYTKIAETGKPNQIEYFSPDLGRNFQISAYSPQKDQLASLVSDITERIEAEEETQKSEEKFRLLFETMTQGVIIRDKDGKAISINPAAEKILGLSAQMMVGKTIKDLSWYAIRQNGEMIPGGMSPPMVALRTGRPIKDFVYGLHTPYRKNIVWLNSSTVPLFREGEEEPYQVFTTFLDITDQIRVQQVLQERLKEMRCLSNIGSLLQKDPSISVICEFTAKEIVNAVQHPGVAVGVVELAGQEYVENASAGEGVRQLAAEIKSHDETFGKIYVCYVEDRDFILPEKQEMLDHVAERLALWYERRQALTRLEESEQQFRNAILYDPYPVMIHAEDGEVLTLNRAWVEESGYSQEDIPDISTWLGLAYGDGQEALIEIIQTQYEPDAGVSEQQSKIRTKSGEIRSWVFTSAPLGTTPDGRKTAITIARDVTEEEQYYNRIKGLQEIDQAIGSTLDLDEVLELITSGLGDLIAFDSMAVLLINGDELEVIACQGFAEPDKIIGLSFPSKPKYPNYDVLVSQKPLSLKNVSEAYPLFHQPVNSGLVGRINAWLGIPLVDRDRAIGMFTVDRRTEEEFTENDIDIATQFANRAAVAITNAQLYERTLSQLRKLEILREIDAAITGSLDLNETLLVVLTHIIQGLNVDAASVLLYDAETRTLGMEQGVGFQSEIRPELTINLGQGFSGQVAETRKPLFIQHIEYTDDGHSYPVDLEAEGIVSFYALPLSAKGNLKGVLQLYSRSKLEPDQDWFDFAEALAGQGAVSVDNIMLFVELEEANEGLLKAYDATIEGWAHALELRDQETEGHSQRVVGLSLLLAKEFGFDDQELAHLRRGILLHDIGKMAIPDKILHKPGPLTEDEWTVMRQHPVFAYEMLKEIDYLKPALDIPHFHHERWDGSGYPEGLKGEEIPLVARIFAVVDIWDALTSDRPYRGAWSQEKTRQYLRDQAGKELDPEIVRVFLALIDGD